MKDARDVDTLDLSGFAPAELRRRLRHACVLLGAAEVPTEQREQILRRARAPNPGGSLRNPQREVRESDRLDVVQGVSLITKAEGEPGRSGRDG
jgi:hypothetical protein